MRPPGVARWLLGRVLDGDRHDAIAGDLEELFDRRVQRDGVRAARRWYRRQVASALRDWLDRRRTRRSASPGNSMLQTLAGDFRFAARTLARQPGFTLIAVLTLALGIGANATVFSWVNAVLLDPLPGVRRSGELVEFAFVRGGERSREVSVAEYEALQAGVPAFAGLAARDDLAIGLSTGGATSRLWAEVVSGNYFDVLDVRPMVGRLLGPADAVPNAPLVTVLSEPTWRAHFGGDPSVVGTVVSINGHPATVVGVADGVFQGGESGLRYDLWVPLSIYRLLDSSGRSRLDARDFRWLALRGRLGQGATVEAAKAQSAGLVAGWRKAYGGYENHEPDVYGLAESDDGAVGVMRTPLLVLAAVAAIVLLIACANLANLLLARATIRRREMAIRRSLGATRGRLIMHTMAEAVLLACAGAIGAGLALTWTSGLLILLAPPSELPIGLQVAVDRSVVGFTAAVAITTVLLFALVPALHASRVDPQAALRDGGTAVAGRRTGLRRGLVVAQVALSLLLLVASGLCIQSVRAANRIDTGFDLDRGLVAWLDPRAAGYDGARLMPYFDDVARRVAALPGVERVSFARRVPLGFQGMSSAAVAIEGYQPAPDERIVLGYNVVGAGYCATLGIPLLAGRDLQASDAADAPRAILLSSSAALRYFAGRSAIGGRIRVGGEWATVVGVVPDVKQRSLTERPRPFMYLALAQFPSSNVALHVRSPGDPALLATAIRSAVAAANAGVPIFNVAPLAAHVTAATFPQRMAANLLTIFGGLALLLASLGAYGVLSWLVNQRRREIGVRLALGATRAEVFRLVLGSGTALVGIGVLLGLALSAAASGVLRSLLVGISPFDPTTYLTVTGTLAVIGVAACAVPARRAAAADPARILREE